MSKPVLTIEEALKKARAKKVPAKTKAQGNKQENKGDK